MKDFDSLGKYAKLAIISSLNRSRSLSELGREWYGENGRFYKKKARAHIKEAEKEGFLSFDGSGVRTNGKMFITEAYEKGTKKREAFESFWSHKFSMEAYYDFEVIKSMVKGNPERASSLCARTVLNMPLLLHILQGENPASFNMVVRILEYQDYISKINERMEMHLEDFKNLDESLRWKDLIDKAAKHYTESFEDGNGGLLDGNIKLPVGIGRLIGNVGTKSIPEDS